MSKYVLITYFLDELGYGLLGNEFVLLRILQFS
ncbi:hypothetical protein NIES37_21440 [Tolypothrix tenuis PCC 7101]|uniref:Uncharacterized protein n=1 Tax=Tolypothrix tenuis PCC 7101 TaxID=231146 RepID=A0A1Z4MXG8_9CYAN|nr:hypothetical protein NIES37_21440 [Tolypothrix tenuis PCC 7101]BAZ77885.1 hypothetical protein NIES50_65180 [Aulosira laxa NIES-50]